VGGLTGKKITKGRVNRVELKMLVNDPTEPVWFITFLNEPTNRGTAQYKHASQDAQHWHGLLSIMIKRAENSARSMAPSFASAPPELIAPSQRGRAETSVAEQLASLASLVDKGFLTDGEFALQKKKLLS
jgi:hypothetical protein